MPFINPETCNKIFQISCALMGMIQAQSFEREKIVVLSERNYKFSLSKLYLSYFPVEPNVAPIGALQAPRAL